MKQQTQQDLPAGDGELRERADAGDTDKIGRYRAGWRSGKPVEDPDKLKRWGFVTAKPSEFLVTVRDGQIDRRRSGQGARIFKWPWESVAIIPTTLQRLSFRADQITRERVGVSVTGLAVYRVVEPELAFRVLNFTYGEAAGEKLSHTLREMFVGSARRLIANLTLDECLMKRKEAIAAFLLREIAPVVGGQGAAGDSTDQGWGVVLDTIEIQDVQVLSRQVFEHLQAPYRAELAARAELAELDRQRLVAERRAETQRRSEEANVQLQRETRALRARAEAEAADAAAQVTQRAAELKQLQSLYDIRAAEEQRRAQAKAQLAILAAEAERSEAEHAAALRALEAERGRRLAAHGTEVELRQRQGQLDLLLRRGEAELRALEGEVEAAQQRRLAEIEQMLAQGRALRELCEHGLPKIAAAFQQSFGTIHYTQVGGAGADGGGPLSLVSGAIAELLALARGLGLDPAALGGRGGSAGAAGPGRPAG